ncbi:MAG: non-ribosomal peptide synthetase, partial [Ardenticatenales bacterium]|nr:non-ribosomal peptide synthetase [Ardenticatenales bacterium]
LRPSGSQPPFFCVHPGGGQALAYLDLVRHLDPTWPVYGLQSVGLNEGLEPQRSIKEMATTYLAAIRERQPEGPYLLGGWSMGGVVAFEMARQLQAVGEQVALLALFDAMLPSPDQPTITLENQALLYYFAQDLGLTMDDLVQAQADSEEEQLDLLLQRAIEKNQLPPDLTRQQIQRLLQVFRANYQAMLDYQAQPYQGRVLLWRAAERRTGGPQEAHSEWSRWVTEGLEVRMTLGTHFTLLRPPHVQHLAEDLGGVLSEVWVAP